MARDPAFRPNKPGSVPRVDDWRVLNGIFWGLRSGAPWCDLPGRAGPRNRSGDNTANTVAKPSVISPSDVSFKGQAGAFTLSLAPASVTVLVWSLRW